MTKILKSFLFAAFRFFYPTFFFFPNSYGLFPLNPQPPDTLRSSAIVLHFVVFELHSYPRHSNQSTGISSASFSIRFPQNSDNKSKQQYHAQSSHLQNTRPFRIGEEPGREWASRRRRCCSETRGEPTTRVVPNRLERLKHACLQFNEAPSARLAGISSPFRFFLCFSRSGGGAGRRETRWICMCIHARAQLSPASPKMGTTVPHNRSSLAS